MGAQSPACEGIQVIGQRCELLERRIIIRSSIVSVNLRMIGLSELFLVCSLLRARPQRRFVTSRAGHAVVRTPDMVSTKSIPVTHSTQAKCSHDQFSSASQEGGKVFFGVRATGRESARAPESSTGRGGALRELLVMAIIEQLHVAFALGQLDSDTPSRFPVQSSAPFLAPLFETRQLYAVLLRFRPPGRFTASRLVAEHVVVSLQDMTSTEKLFGAALCPGEQGGGLTVMTWRDARGKVSRGRKPSLCTSVPQPIFSAARAEGFQIWCRSDGRRRVNHGA
ncbi:uncharacterized protein EDB91DRAFT_1339738 [Suillus paluster]|uniref:uncharacterized protein n=1 Tax=Suillus paluster TaxID=48578 RepID=UPI001B867607|nr:uncharacterized protein EDB91DRAFT_1339738 [Suillus paluster]KAG1725883.1 hypothetical protein EDB91DRAFT_1339738 [Suillus paluster]